MRMLQVFRLEQQLCISTGQPSSSPQLTDLSVLTNLDRDLVTPTPPQPLTSLPGVDCLSDLSSESEHSSPETNTPGRHYSTSNRSFSYGSVTFSTVMKHKLL